MEGAVKKAVEGVAKKEVEGVAKEGVEKQEGTTDISGSGTTCAFNCVWR